MSTNNDLSWWPKCFNTITLQVVNGISSQVRWDAAEHLVYVFMGMTHHQETQMNLRSVQTSNSRSKHYSLCNRVQTQVHSAVHSPIHSTVQILHLSSRKRHQFDEQSSSVPGMRPLKVAWQVQKSNPAMQQKEEDLDKALQEAFVGKQSKCLIIAFHTTKAQKWYGSSHRADTFQMEKFVLSVKCRGTECPTRCLQCLYRYTSYLYSLVSHL